jgi:hypothetical protein
MSRVVLSLLVLSACGKDSQDSQDSTDSVPTPEVEFVDCSMDLPVLPWGDVKPTEAQGGIPEALDALDFTELADPIDVSELLPLYLGLVAYALEIAPEDLGDTLSHEEILAAGDLGRVVLGSFLKGQNDPLGMNFSFFRRGFYHYYTCSKGFPLTLEGFKATYGDYDSATGVVVDSIAKCGDRNLIPNEEAGVYVAETIVDGPVRETEILLKGYRSDGNLDFLVYDSDGLLTTRTVFPTVSQGPMVVTSSPYACISCHFNSDRTEHAVGVDIVRPSVGPCK